MNTGWILGILLALLTGNLQTGYKPQKMNYEKHRVKMVVDQVVNRGVADARVIGAMEKVKRHLFVPDFLKRYAYRDRPLPIGKGQTISQPYIVALMTELLNLNNKDRILEIGTGSGYQAAVLAELCAEVYTIEIVESLQERAAFVLDSLGYENVWARFGDGYLGWLEKAPFDGIIVTCSPTKIPQPLLDQLSEGGRLVIPVGAKNVKKLVLLKKKNGKLTKQDVIPVRFVPMVNKEGESY